MTGNNDANKPAAERQYDPAKPDMRRLLPIAGELSSIVKSEDESRPVTMALAYPELSAKLGMLEHLDVAGYNYKEQYYEADHKDFPQIPFLGSENGHSYEAWDAVKSNDYISGQFLWTGIDYLGEAHGWPVHGSGAGILDCAGFEKQDITAENHCGVKNRSFILPQDRGVRNLQSGSHVGKTGITKLEKRSS